MTFEDQIKKLKKGDIPKLLLVQGNERYLNEKVEAAILQGAFGGEIDEFSFGRYDMEVHPIDEALAEAQSMPFFSDYRVIFIEHPYFLTSERNKADVDHDLEWLEEYIESPSSFTKFIIFASYDSLDNRKKINKKLKKNAQLISTQPFSAQDSQAYIRQLIQSEGYHMDESAYQSFLELTDQDLSRMMNEITKIMIYKGQDRQISQTDVENLVTPSLNRDIFSLNDAILKQELKEALDIFQDLLLQKESPLKLMSILLGQFRLLLQVKILRKKGYQADDIKAYLNVHPYRIKLALAAEKNYSKNHLEIAIKQLIVADFQVKMGGMEDKKRFELFIIRYCGQKIN